MSFIHEGSLSEAVSVNLPFWVLWVEGGSASPASSQTDGSPHGPHH